MRRLEEREGPLRTTKALEWSLDNVTHWHHAPLPRTDTQSKSNHSDLELASYTIQTASQRFGQPPGKHDLERRCLFVCPAQAL